MQFNFVKNEGIAFGLPFFKPLLILLILVILALLVGQLIESIKKNQLLVIIALSMMIIGAGSNLIDRLKYGFVIDYLNVPWFTVFNLADISITLGVTAYLILALLNQDAKK